jgi:hypothetical protein
VTDNGADRDTVETSNGRVDQCQVSGLVFRTVYPRVAARVNDLPGNICFPVGCSGGCACFGSKDRLLPHVDDWPGHCAAVRRPAGDGCEGIALRRPVVPADESGLSSVGCPPTSRPLHPGQLDCQLFELNATGTQRPRVSGVGGP